jgi:hypothetical protein
LILAKAGRRFKSACQKNVSDGQPYPCIITDINNMNSLMQYFPICSKHDADTTVRAIRKNLKDMKTSDMTWSTGEPVEHMQAVDEQNESEDVHMSSYNDKKRGPDEVYEHSTANTTDVETDSSNPAVDAAAIIPPASPRKKPTRRGTPDIDVLQEPITTTNHQKEDNSSQESETSSQKKGGLFAQFAGKSSQTNGHDWSDFAEEPAAASKPSSQEKAKPQPKYAFGSSSGFGTKGWGAAHQTAPVPGGSPFGSTGKVNILYRLINLLDLTASAQQRI